VDGAEEPIIREVAEKLPEVLGGVIESDGDGRRRWGNGRREGGRLEGGTSGERGRRE